MALAAVGEFAIAWSTGKPAFIVAGVFIMLVLAVYLHGTLRGKFVAWGELIRQLKLHGDERVLDMGCGRGAVLLLAAQHLTTGRAVGIDLWRSMDQSGNSSEATRRNAIAEGVSDRVELHDADMRALPFEDHSFDVVLSSLAIHNIATSAGRKQAISEAVRVLRPGGRVVIIDVRGTRLYEARLADLGMTSVERRRLGWQFWRGGAWVVAAVVTATKPA